MAPLSSGVRRVNGQLAITGVVGVTGQCSLRRLRRRQNRLAGG